MSSKSTPFLLAGAVIMGLLAFLSTRSHDADPRVAQVAADRILPLSQGEMREIRVKQDFWNTFALSRTTDGSWELSEPATEPASQAAANRLAETLEVLPFLERIDTPADDTERYREFGLWEPRLTVTVASSESQYTIAFGADTADGKGVYCALEGRDEVYVTPAAHLKVVAAGYESYRAGTARMPSQESGTGSERQSVRH